MTAPHIVDPARAAGRSSVRRVAGPDAHLLSTVINALLSADADAVCGAEYGQPEPGAGELSATATGTATWTPGSAPSTSRSPSCATGSYFPEWLLERRKRAESALITVVATCYLLGVSTRRMDKLVQTLGITSLSKSQVSRMAADLDEQVAAFRTRPLGEAGPFTFVAADALTMKVREDGRVVNAVVLVATGVNGDGHREVLGMKVATSETGAAWNAFFADLVARGLTGVELVTSDAHAGLVEAIAANLPGATWQRCRTHYAANLMTVCPKSAGAGSRRCCTRVYDQPDADAVHAQFDRAARLRDRQAARRRRPPRRRPRRHARVHRLPQGDLAPDLVQQPQRAPEPGDPPPHRRRRHLPRPRRRHPPRRRRPGRAARRMGRRPPLPRPRRPRPRPRRRHEPDHRPPPTTGTELPNWSPQHEHPRPRGARPRRSSPPATHRLLGRARPTRTLARRHLDQPNGGPHQQPTPNPRRTPF